MDYLKFRSYDFATIGFFSIFLLSLPSSTQSSSDSFYSLIRSHGLPIGIVPNNITKFTVDEITGRFEVSLYRSCSAKFENEVHYEINVTGTLTYGQIGDLSGMSAQELFLWFPVKEIRVDVPTSGLIYFDVGGVVSKQFSLSLFETPPVCVDVGPVDVNHQMLNFSRMEAEFEKLAKFASALVATDKDRAKRFIFGLRAEIKKDVMMFQPVSYAEALEKARIAEQGMNALLDESEEQPRKRYRSNNMQGNNSSGSREGQSQKPIAVQEQQAVIEKCTRCGGDHFTIDCRWTTGACFRCGSKDHRIAECPLIKNQTREKVLGEAPKQRVPGRVYALTEEASDD